MSVMEGVSSLGKGGMGGDKGGGGQPPRKRGLSPGEGHYVDAPEKKRGKRGKGKSWKGKCLTCGSGGHDWERCREQCMHCAERHFGLQCPTKTYGWYNRLGGARSGRSMRPDTVQEAPVLPPPPPPPPPPAPPPPPPQQQVEASFLAPTQTRYDGEPAGPRPDSPRAIEDTFTRQEEANIGLDVETAAAEEEIIMLQARLDDINRRLIELRDIEDDGGPTCAQVANQRPSSC